MGNYFPEWRFMVLYCVKKSHEVNSSVIW